MDASHTVNISLMIESKHLNQEVVNLSDKINSSLSVALLSSNENKNSETTSFRKQKLKEYLTTTCTTDKNILSTNELVDKFSAVNFIPKIEDYNKPVKVKSLWTHISQMELALESSPSLLANKILPNLPQSSEVVDEVFTMAFASVKTTKNTKNTRKSVQENNQPNVRVFAERTEDTVQKKKRGRPKKVVVNIEEKTPIVSNAVEHSIESNSLVDLKSDDLILPKVVKRGRGRPRKSDVTKVVETPQINSSTPTLTTTLSPTSVPKKRGRKKRIYSNVSVDSDSFNDQPTKSMDKTLVVINSPKVVELQSSEPHSSEPHSSEPHFLKEHPLESDIELCDSLDCCDNMTNEQKTNKTIQIKATELLSDIDPSLVIEFNKVNWNVVPEWKGSKSCDDILPKTQSRRNSLSENMVFTSFGLLNKNMKSKRIWKSLSFLEGGPNIEMERQHYKELEETFRSTLTRSRSFPNCLILDTIVWRFLIRHQTVLSTVEMNLINEIPQNGYGCLYRSISEPSLDGNCKVEKNLFSQSLSNLDKLYCTNNVSVSPLKIPQNQDNLKNSVECGSDECKSKIRRSKRLNTKIKDSDMFDDTYVLESNEPTFNYLLHSEKIRKDNEEQLSEARKNDPELDTKLKKLNFTLITNNMFRPHRKDMSVYTPGEAQELRRLKPKKTISNDAFSCHCKYTKNDWIEGKPGCGSECLNRLLNIECGPSCFLKSFCTNKQFQNKQFKRTEIVKTPDKGYGVFALEDIPSGTFVDEYIGEVIDQHEMIKRMKKKLYINNNYMVQLKHDEFIDATRKGNITRFINHSCEPNCIAEKWNVLGESRMGFFSKELISKGEEITFNYSFELFGNAEQQKCYCGTSKCRGFISKKSRTSDDEYEDTVLTTKPEESKEKKEKTVNKEIIIKVNKRLQELNQQLTDISKLKNKNRSDLESSTLNLNKLMVHITDSMSQLHILQFIRDNDLDCKRLFMNFNGLSIIHSWMISRNNDTVKLDIIKTLSDLPISNRNTITKSKVLDIVAEWANIPLRIKEIIENLEYPVSKSEEHSQEVDKLLPEDNSNSPIVEAARILWKKWIVLKMVFKIPKLERPKDAIITNISNDVITKSPKIPSDISKPSIILPQLKPKLVQYNFGKPIVPNQSSKVNYNHIKNTFINEKSVQSQDPRIVNTISIDTFSKILNQQNQINARDNNKAILEWNKKQWESSAFKTSNVHGSTVKYPKNFILNKNYCSTFAFDSNDIHQEIPTIESSTISKKIKYNPPATKFIPKVYEVPTDASIKSISDYKTIEPIKYFPIEEIITSKQSMWNQAPPTISELNNESTLKSLFKMPPPCLFDKNSSSVSNQTNKKSIYFKSSLTKMSPENLLYDAQHPSLKEQFNFMSAINSINNKNLCVIKTSDKYFRKPSSNKSKIDAQLQNINNQKELPQQSAYNLNKLHENSSLNDLKSAKNTNIGLSEVKKSKTSLKKNCSVTKKALSFAEFFKNVKLLTNLFQNQPSNIIKINNLDIESITRNQKNNIFRIIEEKEAIKSDSLSVALKFQNKQLRTVPNISNVKKLLNKQSIEVKTENKFAHKIFNGLMKKCSKLPKNFVLQSSSDEVITINPKKEIELYHKLTPSIKNILCAKVKKGGRSINVFEQVLSMKYNESKHKTPAIESRPPSTKNSDLIKNMQESRKVVNTLKRKLPLPPMENIKSRKLDKSSTNHLGKPKSIVKTSQTGDDGNVFKKPMVPVIRNKQLSTNGSISNQRPPRPNISNQLEKGNVLLGTNTEETILELGTSCQITSGYVQSNMSYNETRQKPLMKCLPFNKMDNISVSELEQKAKTLAICLSRNYSSNKVPLTQSTNDELIDPVVQNFKSSMTPKKTNLVDDPIVRDYIQRTQMKTLESKRKCKLPESMSSLPAEVLNLIPDNPRELKCVVDFFHAMAKVIVKVLDFYVKKNCKQGRIKNNQDFKYLAKKLNSNILYKELQAKNVEDLKISDSVKLKVQMYINKYMLKHGSVYRQKSTDQ